MQTLINDTNLNAFWKSVYIHRCSCRLRIIDESEESTFDSGTIKKKQKRQGIKNFTYKVFYSNERSEEATFSKFHCKCANMQYVLAGRQKKIQPAVVCSSGLADTFG